MRFMHWLAALPSLGNRLVGCRNSFRHVARDVFQGSLIEDNRGAGNTANHFFQLQLTGLLRSPPQASA